MCIEQLALLRQQNLQEISVAGGWFEESSMPMIY